MIKVRIELDWQYEEIVCSCGINIAPDREHLETPVCDADASDFAGQWQDFCADWADRPARGVTVTFCHEQEVRGDFWFEVELADNFDRPAFDAFLRRIRGRVECSSAQWEDLLSADLDLTDATAEEKKIVMQGAIAGCTEDYRSTLARDLLREAKEKK